MTVKLVVLYTQPDDAAAFEAHYFGTHMPLVAQLPGLLRAETGKFAPRQAYYRAAELYFPDEATLNAAVGSAPGVATAADFQQIAPPGSQMLVQEVDDRA
jgi:uncharacterized protein (TIGR02118 family)